MIKLSDYVIQFLAERGVCDLFTVSGGGIMHLLESVGRHRGMRYWCNYHEQACAIAAEGYARVRGTPGACLVTVGPGAVNAIAGIPGAWYDSVPTITIAGQVRRDLIADYSKVRQIGPQEGNAVAMAKPVTKYAVTVLDPMTIKQELERAWHAATTGRPGPVLVEVPLDVQGTMIDESALPDWQPPPADPVARSRLEADVAAAVAALRRARRPLFTAGNGIHLSRSEKLWAQFLDRLPFPVVLPDMGKDLVPEDHPRNVGIFGTAGQRRANFAVQNADCILSLGAGLCLKKVGYNFKGFAPKAKKIIVDIDESQVHQQVLKPDLGVVADVRDFMAEMLRQIEGESFEPSPKWLGACANWKKRYPLITEDYFADPAHVNSYVFVDKLADALEATDIVVGGNGLDTVSCIQAFKVKPGQRTMTSGNWGSMGWDLPLSVGASVGGGSGGIGGTLRRTVCLAGDGSIQWNVQELLTIGSRRLPVKIFLFNNRGYTSIRMTQNAFFEGHFVASEAGSGVSNPDFAKLAAAYGLAYDRINVNAEIDAGVRRVLDTDGPVLCELNLSPEQGIAPKASAFRRPDGTFESRPLEDMAPFLPREEIHENMHLFDDEGERPFPAAGLKARVK